MFLIAIAGVVCAIALAVLAGATSARLFFDATREPEEER